MITRVQNLVLSLTRPQKIAVMVLIDLLALPVCLLLAYALQLDSPHLGDHDGLAAAVIMAMATLPVFHLGGLYRNVVRFLDVRMLRATGIGLASLTLGTYALSVAAGALPPPPDVLFIYWFTAYSYVLVSRFGARNMLRQGSAKRLIRPRVAIYGAGEAGFQLVNSMRDSRTHTPICFFDDDGRLVSRHVSGLRVYGMQDVERVVDLAGIDQVVLAIPSASPERRKVIVNRFARMGILVKTLPTLAELGDSSALENTIREVRVEDLLGRKAVPPMEDLFARCIAGKSVLVTGAGGSIGSELCRQIESQHPAKLLLLEHSEFALYSIENELKGRFPETQVIALLGSVCDRQLVERILRAHHVDTIYHAAAYKHVPLVEANMAEGLRNNVQGAWTIARAAVTTGVATCVLVSTDKAVRPTNIMGASKRCAELIFQALALHSPGQTVFSMVRFGNVLGSSGSVVPLFREQIRRGGPITLTHPEMTRYFMLIPEAAQLVIQAGAMAKGGEVFVLDMGEPVQVIELARTMIETSGRTERTADNPEGDIEIQVTGLRPGEKLYEELLIGGEIMASAHPRIMSSHEHRMELAELVPCIAALMGACASNDPHRIQTALQAVVSEYTPYSAFRPAVVAEPQAQVKGSRPAASPLSVINTVPANGMHGWDREAASGAA